MRRRVLGTLAALGLSSIAGNVAHAAAPLVRTIHASGETLPVVGLGSSVGQWWLERRTMSRAAAAAYLGEFIWHALSGAAAEHGVDLSALDPGVGNVRPLRKEADQ